jgi:hypothetical protein
MSTFKHKIIGSVGSELSSMVIGLPKMAKFNQNGEPVYKREPMMGRDVKKLDPTDGKYADDVLYNVPILQYVDHLACVRQIFKVEGMRGAKAYVDEVWARKALQEHESARLVILNGKWHRKIYNWVKRIFWK